MARRRTWICLERKLWGNKYNIRLENAFLYMVYQLIYITLSQPRWPFRTYYMPQWERLKRQNRCLVIISRHSCPHLVWMIFLPSREQHDCTAKPSPWCASEWLNDSYKKPKQLVKTESYVTWIVLHMTSVKYVKLT